MGRGKSDGKRTRTPTLKGCMLTRPGQKDIGAKAVITDVDDIEEKWTEGVLPHRLGHRSFSIVSKEKEITRVVKVSC